jgi:hypothetical protein
LALPPLALRSWRYAGRHLRPGLRSASCLSVHPCPPTATCVPLSRRRMPQCAGHHPRASPPEGRNCRRQWRCRLPTAARPPESVARPRSWRHCTTRPPPLPCQVSSGSCVPRTVPVHVHGGLGYACARRTVLPSFRSHSSVRTREVAVRAGVGVHASGRSPAAWPPPRLLFVGTTPQCHLRCTAGTGAACHGAIRLRCPHSRWCVVTCCFVLRVLFGGETAAVHRGHIALSTSGRQRCSSPPLLSIRCHRCLPRTPVLLCARCKTSPTYSAGVKEAAADAGFASFSRMLRSQWPLYAASTAAVRRTFHSFFS